MSKSIYIDAHASVSRPHTRKPYHHPWWRQCYRLYERRLDHIHAQYPHAYAALWIGAVVATIVICGGVVIL